MHEQTTDSFRLLNTAHTESARDVQAFQDDRLGMFVHWGVYSDLGGEWKGQYQKTYPLSEHIMQIMQIPLAEYREVAKRFNPPKTWARDLCETAHSLGARYIVFHAKQHDGYCAFRTAVTDFNSWDINGRDFVAEIADACRSSGIRLGLYYSQDLDWSQEHGGGWLSITGKPANADNYWDWPDRDKKDFSIFFRTIVKPHIRELLTNYGDIALLWFDFPHNINTAQCEELYALVKSIQPHCLVDSRIGPAQADYFTLADNEIPTVPLGQPQECLITLNQSWGYNAFDHDWKAPKQLIDILARCLSSGVNLLTNVGPLGDGSLPMGTRHLVETLGVWYHENRDTLYGTRGSPLRVLPEWGYLACRDRELFLYMKDNAFCLTEAQRTHTLSGLPCRVLEIRSAADGTSIPFTQEGCELTFTVPNSRYFMPVYRVLCAEKLTPQTDIRQQGTVLTLHPYWAKKLVCGELSELPVRYNSSYPDAEPSGLLIDRSGTVDRWCDASDSLCWEAYFTQPGLYTVELITQVIQGDVPGVRISVTDAEGRRETAEADPPRETGRDAISNTRLRNVRVRYTVGTLQVACSGRAAITIRRLTSDETPLPLTLLRLEKQD